MSADGTPPTGGGKLLLFRARPDAAADAAADAGAGAAAGVDAGADAPEQGAAAERGLAPGYGLPGHLLTFSASASTPVPAPTFGFRRRTTVVVAVAAVGLLGAGVTAYAGLLPVPAQGMAHSAIGAPAPLARSQAQPDPAADPPEPGSGGSPAGRDGEVAAAPPTLAPGPEVDAPAVYGLCLAFDRAVRQQDDAASAKAFRNLARAAGGAANVQAYCAGTAPGSTR